MPLMKSLQNLRLETTEGAVLRFSPDKPTYVPPRAVAAASARGCVMVNEADRTFHEDMTRLNVDFSGEIRQSLMFLALKSLMEKNDHKNFDGAGHPTDKAMSDLVGFPVASSEIPPIFQLWHQVQDGGEYQVHPSAEQAQRVLEADSKAELVELGKEMGVDENVLKTTAKELRKILLVKLSGYTPAE